MQRDVDLLRASVPLYSCPPCAHLNPDFIKNSIKTVLMEQGYDEERAWAAAGRIEEKCREACKRD